jgi:hypothetical protein
MTMRKGAGGATPKMRVLLMLLIEPLDTRAEL